MHCFTARKHGLSEVSQEVFNLVSHATQERLRNILEKLSTISLHRLEVYRVCRITLLKIYTLSSTLYQHHKRASQINHFALVKLTYIFLSLSCKFKVIVN